MASPSEGWVEWLKAAPWAAGTFAITPLALSQAPPWTNPPSHQALRQNLLFRLRVVLQIKKKAEK